MTDYEKQASDFLEKTGATIEAKLIGNFPYFDDDKESRDVYQITIARVDKKPWVFRFGQSIANSKGNTIEGEHPTRISSAKKLHYENSGYKYLNPVGWIKRAKKPTAYDILACLTKYDPGTFEDFCDNFGYDTDSRKAEKTYFAVQKEFSECQKMFGDVIEELAEIN